ncbi:MAG: acetylornithine/succinylornithine family transaminase [Oscillospiraceae bacterium]
MMTKAKGAICYDDKGESYIDFGSGIGVNSLGYCDDEWSEAVCNQAKTLQHCSNYYYSKPAADVAKTLCENTFAKKVFLANSGAEANECAIKVARKYSYDKYGENRNNIITLVNSFHGRTVTTLSATGQESFHNYFFPFTQGFYYALANDIEDFKNKLDDTVCAVMVEFIQGEGGVVPLEKEYVKQLEDICKEKDVLFIADEVQTGIARTGKLLTSEHFSFNPDITTLAKGLGGGLPIGAVLLGEKTESTLGVGTHGTTFGGNPVSCAGANVVLKRVLQKGFMSQVEKNGQFIRDYLRDIPEVDYITGIGMMVGIKLKTKTAAEVLLKCKQNGLLVLTAKEKIRLLPPLTISQKELESGLKILANCLTQL